MAHVDIEIKRPGVNHELLLEELAAAGIRGLIGVQVVPSGGFQHRLRQMPPPRYEQNPEWPAWLPNPDWHEGAGPGVERFVENQQMIAEWKHGLRAPTNIRSHVRIDADPADYTTQNVYEDAGVTVIIRLSEPPDGDMYAIIQGVVEKHDPTGKSSREKAEQEKQTKQDAAIAALKAHADPAIQGIADVFVELLRKSL